MRENNNKHFERGELLVDISRWREAIHEFNQCLAANPNDYKTFCNLALCYMELNDLQTALGFTKSAIETEPESEWAYRLQSLIYSDNKEHDKALQSAEVAVSILPNAEFSLRTLIYAQINKWQIETAEETAELMLSVAPESADTHDAVGYLAMRKEKWEDAKASFIRALEIDPESFYSLYNLGLVYKNDLEKGETKKSQKFFKQKAIETFEAALRVKPTSIHAQNHLKELNAKPFPLWTIVVFFISICCFPQYIYYVIAFVFYLLNPYSPNPLNFLLNLYFIVFIILGGLMYWGMQNPDDDDVSNEKLNHPLAWGMLLTIQVLPILLYLVLYFIYQITPTPFTIISFSVFSIGVVFSIYGLVKSALKVKESEEKNSDN